MTLSDSLRAPRRRIAALSIVLCKLICKPEHRVRRTCDDACNPCEVGPINCSVVFLTALPTRSKLGDQRSIFWSADCAEPSNTTISLSGISAERNVANAHIDAKPRRDTAQLVAVEICRNMARHDHETDESGRKCRLAS
jgi:hypothetical protein